MSETAERQMLDMEYRLTIVYRRACECAPYLLRRRDVLLPAVMRRATARHADPVDLFANFARGVHARHLAGASLDTPSEPTR